MQAESSYLIKFLSTLLISGTLGFINYNILVNRGVFSVNSRKDERNKSYIFLSFIDFLVFQFIYNCINIALRCIKSNNILFVFLNENKLIIGIVISLTLIYCASPYIVPIVQKHLYEKYNKKRNQNNLADIVNKYPSEQAFDTKNIFVFIFDFDHKYITCGFVYSLNPSLEFKNQFILKPLKKNKYPDKFIENIELIAKSDKAFEKASEFLESDPNENKIYVDTDQKLIYFSFYLSSH
ncbi:hypothetical protein M3M39_05805 [Fructilactobacillus hinvesii]|uniref:Uncharacterized protein n=1 Tax=Fructilactobacillus hinvesii TaxID=2940300 RepID=A0ABY5BSK4_9LACO|nr:hypothetical protein [Fructilactobacillus hinvesii]USS87635.1 hypothetical protein M3M39_05805 [Fructilactobacillus hinvesii]